MSLVVPLISPYRYHEPSNPKTPFTSSLLPNRPPPLIPDYSHPAAACDIPPPKQHSQTIDIANHPPWSPTPSSTTRPSLTTRSLSQQPVSNENAIPFYLPSTYFPQNKHSPNTTQSAATRPSAQSSTSRASSPGTPSAPTTRNPPSTSSMASRRTSAPCARPCA